MPVVACVPVVAFVPVVACVVAHVVSQRTPPLLQRKSAVSLRTPQWFTGFEKWAENLDLALDAAVAGTGCCVVCAADVRGECL